jgi:beta-N-acetylhexosaminidase
MSSPASAGRPRSGLSRRQALAGFGIALIGGVSAPAASARAAVAPARRARAGLAAGLTNLQLAGQRVIGSYPGLTPPASLFTDISNGQVAGVIFFGENISSETQIAGVITQLRQAQAQSPVQVPLLLMTDQEGGLVRRLPRPPLLFEAGCPASRCCRRNRSGSPPIRWPPRPRPAPVPGRTWPAWA